MTTNDHFGLPTATIEKINSVFAQHANIVEAIIYGSRAKGTFGQGSDIDLTLIGENLTTTELLKIENELDDLLLPYSIDLSLLSQIESQDLKDHIARVGVRFFVQQA